MPAGHPAPTPASLTQTRVASPRTAQPPAPARDRPAPRRHPRRPPPRQPEAQPAAAAACRRLGHDLHQLDPVAVRVAQPVLQLWSVPWTGSPVIGMPRAASSRSVARISSTSRQVWSWPAALRVAAPRPRRPGTAPELPRRELQVDDPTATAGPPGPAGRPPGSPARGSRSRACAPVGDADRDVPMRVIMPIGSPTAGAVTGDASGRRGRAQHRAPYVDQQHGAHRPTRLGARPAFPAACRWPRDRGGRRLHGARAPRVVQRFVGGQAGIDFYYNVSAARIGLRHGWAAVYDRQLYGELTHLRRAASYANLPATSWLALPFTGLPSARGSCSTWCRCWRSSLPPGAGRARRRVGAAGAPGPLSGPLRSLLGVYLAQLSLAVMGVPGPALVARAPRQAGAGGGGARARLPQAAGRLPRAVRSR